MTDVRKILYGGVSETREWAERSASAAVDLNQQHPITGHWLEEPHVIGPESDGEGEFWRWEGVWALGWYTRQRMTRDMPRALLAAKQDRIQDSILTRISRPSP
jgi:hypothetical protein